MVANLEKAIEIATKAHEGQARFDGSPYITHPLWVMESVREAGFSEEIQMTAVLHDVVEDTEVTFEDLIRRGIPEKVIFTLGFLTKDSGEEYEEYIRFLALNPAARVVKIRDMRHNAGTLPELGDNRILSDEEIIRRNHKYAKSLAYLYSFPEEVI